MAPKVMKPDEEPGEILNEEELVDVRLLIALMKRKDVGYLRLEKLLDEQPDIHEIVDGKKASVWVWQQIGAIAKWVAGVIGAIIAYKAFVSGGPKP